MFEQDNYISDKNKKYNKFVIKKLIYIPKKN